MSPVSLLIPTVAIFLAVVSGSSCGEKDLKRSEYLPLKEGLTTLQLPASAPGGSMADESVPVDVYVSPDKGAQGGDILVLPGWDFPRTEWQKKTQLVSQARNLGYRLVFPEMKKTLYESEYFPETTLKWGPVPGAKWIKEILVPSLQRYGLFMPGGRNFLLGLSTGGRGVALLHLAMPDLFKGGAALSGDFDQTAMPSDNLVTAVYGAYNANRKRWTEIDNPQSGVRAWTMPIYLGHGKKDAVVPFSQTQAFFDALHEKRPDVRVQLNAPENAAHDFEYWTSEVPRVLEFFGSVK